MHVPISCSLCLTRNTISLFFPLFCISLLKGQAPDGYYEGLEFLRGDSLKTGLHKLLENHITYNYSSTSTDVWDILKETDPDPEDSTKVIMFYTGWSRNAEAEYNRGRGWSREHVWAKSHGDFGTERGAGTDVHALRPADVTVNSARNNKDFDQGGEIYIDGDGPTENRTDSDSWEPRDEVKGDVARSLFYMVVRYEGDGDEPDLELVDTARSVFSNRPGAGFHGRLSAMLKWHFEDPVDASELRRNDVVFLYQGNRNPFIDHPEWVTKLWDTTGIGKIQPFVPPTPLIEEDITDTLDIDSIIASYYEGFELWEGEELKSRLNDLIQDHQTYNYTHSSQVDVWDILKEADKDTVNKDRVILFYSGRTIEGAQEFNNGLGWVREHIWPTDHGDFGISQGPGTDAHHIRPADNSVSRARGNLDFDWGGREYIDQGDSTRNFVDEDSWEPREEIKGDIARMLFYMATRYEGEKGEPDLELLNEVHTLELVEEGKGYHGKLATLLTWHEEDPVDAYEKRRNNVIYLFQGNRNPYIDHPEYVYRIWDPLLFDSTITAYYSPIDTSTSQELLKEQLHELVDDHRIYPYTSQEVDVWDILKITDPDPNNAGDIRLFYTGWLVEASQEYNNARGWSREHIWSTDHGNLLEFDAASTDVHAIRPADISVNRVRGNLDFDEGGELFVDGNGITQNFRDEDSWEPREEVKGDLARMLFYMAIRYEGEENEPDLELLDTVSTLNFSQPGIGYYGKLSTLLKWHEEDPVGRFERLRNQKVFEFQGNRNPFIDHPEYVKRLWPALEAVDTTQITTSLDLPVRENQHFRLYPNPGKNRILITWKGPELPHAQKISLFSPTGKLLQTYKLNKEGSGELDVNKWPGGVYFVRIDGYSQKLVLLK